jgi:hypothetical protein
LKSDVAERELTAKLLRPFDEYDLSFIIEELMESQYFRLLGVFHAICVDMDKFMEVRLHALLLSVFK